MLRSNPLPSEIRLRRSQTKPFLARQLLVTLQCFIHQQEVNHWPLRVHTCDSSQAPSRPESIAGWSRRHFCPVHERAQPYRVSGVQANLDARGSSLYLGIHLTYFRYPPGFLQYLIDRERQKLIQ